MALWIYQFSNKSPKSVLLTNPYTARDTHLLPVTSMIKPDNPPLIRFLDDRLIDKSEYGLLLRKALNIYTGTRNWCFWDCGKDDRLHMMGERTWKIEEYVFGERGSELTLQIEHDGKPYFHVIK
jgi:hypothetical protein